MKSRTRFRVFMDSLKIQGFAPDSAEFTGIQGFAQDQQEIQGFAQDSAKDSGIHSRFSKRFVKIHVITSLQDLCNNQSVCT